MPAKQAVRSIATRMATDSSRRTAAEPAGPASSGRKRASRRTGRRSSGATGGADPPADVWGSWSGAHHHTERVPHPDRAPFRRPPRGRSRRVGGPPGISPMVRIRLIPCRLAARTTGSYCRGSSAASRGGRRRTRRRVSIRPPQAQIDHPVLAAGQSAAGPAMAREIAHADQGEQALRRGTTTAGPRRTARAPGGARARTRAPPPPTAAPAGARAGCPPCSGARRRRPRPRCRPPRLRPRRRRPARAVRISRGRRGHVGGQVQDPAGPQHAPHLRHRRGVARRPPRAR